MQKKKKEIQINVKTQENEKEEEEEKKDRRPLMNAEEMTEMKKPAFGNHQCKNGFRKDNQWLSNPLAARLPENRIFT